MSGSGFARRGRLAILLGGLALVSAGAVRGPESDAVPVLRKVHQALEAGDLEKALRRLSRLDRSPLADHASLLRARALHRLGRHDEASQAAQAGLSLQPPRELESLLLQELARIEIGREKLLEAYAHQQRAWETTRESGRAAELALELAQAFDASGLPGDALQLYRRIWNDWPLSEVSVRAFERSETLMQGTGAAPPTAFAFLQRAERLREAYRCTEALPLYARVRERATELDPGARKDAQRGEAHCLFNTRRYPEAAQAFKELAGSRSDPEAIRDALQAARAIARGGDEASALRDYETLRARVPPGERGQIDYLRAVTLRSSQPTRYRELLRSVEQQDAYPSLAREARWLLAWEDWLGGRREPASERLTPLARGSLRDIEVQRARYWLAIASAERDPEKTQAMLRELADAQPLSYYGLRAADRLDAGPPAARALVGPRKVEPIHSRAARAGWLIDGGFPELARAELLSWLSDARQSRVQRLQAATLLNEIGEHYRAVQLVSGGFASVLERGIDPDWREVWQLAWPRPFEAQVRAAVGEFRFDPSLVWAVMREESTYRPAIESPAGAIGLMQIMPYTGERIAAQLGQPGFGPEILRIPETNIRFGTYYLSDLVSRFEGSQPLAIAAYNAGPEAVTRWLERDGRQPDDAFVECVSYGETRRYLRRVLRSQRVYRLLYMTGPRPE